jgi:hypothetical protein
VSAPDAAAVEAAVRAEDASGVRALLADATEADRRALAKTLKPLLEGPAWELPEPIVFTSLADGLAFVRSQMTATMRGQEPEPSAGERERREWWQLSGTVAFAALAVGIAGGRAAAGRALDECRGRDYHVSDAELAVIAGVLADRNPPWLAELADARLRGDRWHRGAGSWSLPRWLVRLDAIDRPVIPEYGATMVRTLTQSPPLSGPVPTGGGQPMPEPAGTGGDRLARRILGDPGLLEHEIWRLFTDPGVGREMEGAIRVPGAGAAGPGGVPRRVRAGSAVPAEVRRDRPAQAHRQARGRPARGPRQRRQGQDRQGPGPGDGGAGVRSPARGRPSRALKLIARHGVPRDASARATVAELACALSPVLRPDAGALGLVPAPPAPAVSPVPAAARQRLVAEVDEADGLVLLLAQLMEDASDALAVERALAGAMRLTVLPLAERAQLARPLLKRARKQALGDPYGPFSGQSIRADMGWLTLTWATGELPPASTMEHQGWHPEGHDTSWKSRRPTILSGILSARIGEACTLIAAGRALRLLAEPEFADGTISPGELTARQALWATAGLTPGRYDLEVARLRAAPAVDGELALGPSATRLTARVPESASAPRCWPLLTHLAHPLDDRQFAVGRMGIRLDEMIAAWPLLCPRDPELIAAHLLSPLSDGLGPGRNAAVTAVRGLAGLAGTFGKICHLALVTGLSAASAEARITAADAWTQIAGEGRLDPALAAAALEFGVTRGALKLSRIADGLGYAAADPVASAGVAQSCLTATAALLPAKPAGLHLLLELAARASTTSGMPELPAPVAALARSTATSKLAEAARRLIRLRQDRS